MKARNIAAPPIRGIAPRWIFLGSFVSSNHPLLCASEMVRGVRRRDRAQATVVGNQRRMAGIVPFIFPVP
jgi:hypothetical protein